MALAGGVSSNAVGLWVAKTPVTLLNARAIRAAATINADSLINFSNGKRLFIKAENTLDQNATIQLVGNRSDSFTGAINLDVGAKVCIAGGSIGFSLAWDDWMPYISCTITTAIAPTAGALNIFAIMQE